MPARIVTYVHRPKRPPRKRKAGAPQVPAVVRSGAATTKREPAPASDKPTIVTSTSRKRARLLRAERASEPDDEPEATARVRAFLDRMIKPP